MRKKVDLVVLDFNMPGRDGLDLAAEFRKIRPTMPIAVISANYQREVVDRARAVGATFLPKPVTEQALKEFLATAVQLSARISTHDGDRPMPLWMNLELDALTELSSISASAMLAVKPARYDWPAGVFYRCQAWP